MQCDGEFQVLEKLSAKFARALWAEHPRTKSGVGDLFFLAISLFVSDNRTIGFYAPHHLCREKATASMHIRPDMTVWMVATIAICGDVLIAALNQAAGYTRHNAIQRST